MKLNRLLVACTVALAMICFAQQPGQGKLLKAKDGTFAIYFQAVESASVVTQFKQNGDIEFDASGTRLNGFSKEQGLTFSMNALNGIASGDKGEPKRIKRATASGKVVMDIETKADGGTMDSHLESEQVEMEEKQTESVFKLTKPFLFTNNSKTTDGERLMEFRAPSGTFVLPPLGEPSATPNPFKSAKVQGPVKIKVVSSRKGADGVTSFDVEVRADAMTYDAKERILRLKGNIVGDYVQKSATGEPFGIEMESDQVLIYFDEDSLVTNVKSIIGVIRDKDGDGR